MSDTVFMTLISSINNFLSCILLSSAITALNVYIIKQIYLGENNTDCQENFSLYKVG